jgi:hypothetical protein
MKKAGLDSTPATVSTVAADPRHSCKILIDHFCGPVPSSLKKDE